MKSPIMVGCDPTLRDWLSGRYTIPVLWFLVNRSIKGAIIIKSENGCPFCREHVIDVIESKMPTASDGWQVQCDNCGARGPVYETQEGAIKGWELGIMDLGKRLRMK